MKSAAMQEKRSIPEFLSGGGEMGERIRNYEWSNSALGPIENWPHSLRTCIRIMLTSRQPIWIGWGPQLIKLYNDAYIDIVGGKHPWALGKPATVVWKEILHHMQPMIDQVMNENQGVYNESFFLVMERNGYPEETYYTFSYTPIPGDDGVTAGLICANSDDTQRIITERLMRTLTDLGKALAGAKSNEEIHTSTIATLKENNFDFPYVLFYSIKDQQALLSAHSGNFTSANSIPAIISLDSPGDLSKAISEALQTREVKLFSDITKVMGEMPKGPWQLVPDKAVIFPIVQAGSKEHYGFLITGLNPHRLFDEKNKNFFSLIADQLATGVHDVHVLEEERRRVEALAEIDKAKTIFFSNISHEFRTPLTLLLGPIQDMLVDPAASEDDRSRLEVAYRNALRMQKLVNTLLDFSRLEAGRMEARYSKVDIASLNEDLASTFRSAIEKAGMELRIRVSPVKADVYVDKNMWEKIILNLISNAFKYSKEGVIEIDTSQAGNQLQVTVSDTGIGIPSDQLDDIFKRFHRVENSEGRSQEGTGIGLAMVQELVKLHMGSIEVASEIGKGSVFTVRIPLGKAHLPQDRIAETIDDVNTSTNARAFVEEANTWIDSGDRRYESNAADSTVAYSANGGKSTEVKGKIILADDNADMRNYVKRLLSSYFDVIVAVDGVDAFEKMLKYKPELLLTDIMMPKLDGFGLLKKVRANAELRNIPVIFLSARAGEEAKVEGLDAGADDYLIKPFSAKELIVRVTNQVKINRVRRQTEQQFYQLFFQAPAIINVLSGPMHRFEFFHPKNKEIFGDVDFTGMTVREALPELEGQGIYELLDEVFQQGIVHTHTDRAVTFITKEGEPVQRYFNFTYQPWFDLRGNIQGVLNFAIDNTNQVLARKELEESETRFRTLAETLPQLIWMIDSQGKGIYASSRWKEYAGQPVQEDMWPNLVHPDDLPLAEHVWNASFANGNSYKIELRLKNKDGDYRWFYGQGEPIRDDSGEILKWIGSFTDIHDQKEIESKLEKLVVERTQELRRSNEDLQQFAHVASHDLKEPVRKIKTFTDRLQTEYGELLPERAKTYVDKIHAATNRMYSMIEGVLNYSIINAQQQPIEQLDLNGIVQQIELDLELVIQQKKAMISTSRLPEIEGAYVLIYQLFYNLINNSIKFSQENISPSISITGSVIQVDGINMAKIVFADNGIGFEKGESHLIFETFTRLNSKDKFEGTGLGLALCKKIVERHKGTITASGQLNVGAQFTLTIPLQQEQKQI